MSMKSFMSKPENAEIAEAYSLYTVCRNQALYTYEFSKGDKPHRLLLSYTTGLAILPYEGGVLDQPERLMTFFESFLSGDEHAFYTRINKKA